MEIFTKTQRYKQKPVDSAVGSENTASHSKLQDTWVFFFKGSSKKTSMQIQSLIPLGISDPYDVTDAEFFCRLCRCALLWLGCKRSR